MLLPSPTATGYALDPEAIDAVSLPTIEATTLPPECYYDPGLYRREIARIFSREWICVGRVEEVPQVGDYLTTSIGEEPLVIVRDGAGDTARPPQRVSPSSLRDRRGQRLVKAYHGWCARRPRSTRRSTSTRPTTR